MTTPVTPSTEARDALAAALATTMSESQAWRDVGGWDEHALASAILAALPDGWVLARMQEADRDWTPERTLALLDAIRARLTRIEEIIARQSREQGDGR